MWNNFYSLSCMIAIKKIDFDASLKIRIYIFIFFFNFVFNGINLDPYTTHVQPVKT